MLVSSVAPTYRCNSMPEDVNMLLCAKPVDSELLIKKVSS